MDEFKRTLNIWQVTAVGLGSMIGPGIFVLFGIGAGFAGPGVAISFVFAGLTAFLTAVSAAELVTFIPESGGPFIFTYHAFGTFWSFLVSWMLSAVYLIGGSVVSLGFSGYFIPLLGMEVTTEGLLIVACLLPLGLGLVMLWGLRYAAGATMLLVFLNISALVLFIIIGSEFIIAHGTQGNYVPFLPNGIPGVFQGAAVVFFTFTGFNAVTAVAGEVKDPERTIPRAFLIAFGTCFVLYVAISLVATGLLNWTILAVSPAPIESALSVATHNMVIVGFVSLIALSTTASVLFATIFGGSRQIYAMARRNLLPLFLGRVTEDGVPVSSIILISVLISAVILGTGGDLELLVQFVNVGILGTFFAINLSLVKIRRDLPGIRRKCVMSLSSLAPILSIVFCSLLLISLEPIAIMSGIIWIAIGAIMYRVREKYRWTVNIQHDVQDD